VAFDLLWLNGADSADPCALPFSERRRRLRGILPKGSPAFFDGGLWDPLWQLFLWITIQSPMLHE
jgi:ATP-dependent DNA ligase